jgi:DNA primase
VSEGLLLVECRLDAEAATALGENALAAGGSGDFTSMQIEELRSNPGPLYVLPDADALDAETPRRWVRDLYPGAYLAPSDYGEGLADLSDLLHKRGKATARKVLEELKARAVDGLELELKEAEENFTDEGQLAVYRRAKERILPLLLSLEDEGERDAALRDVAQRLGLGLRPLRKVLADMEQPESSEEEQIEDEAQVEEQTPVAPGEVEELLVVRVSWSDTSRTRQGFTA